MKMSDPIRIRMYNVGFGDCFLLFLPTDAGIRKVLIDCGTIKQNKHPIAKIAKQVIADITDQDDVPRIDVLILSHRHKDHLSGFDADAWSKVQVGEVWMPWVESPTDPDARSIRKEQDAAARGLRAVAGLFALGDTVTEIAGNALDGADNLEFVRTGFVKEPSYLPNGRKAVEEVEAPLLPGIEVFVMGPPRDPDALRHPNPPTEQTLLSGYLDAVQLGQAAQKFQPFGSDWVPDYPNRIFDEAQLQQAASMVDLYELAAAELDADINNTSLILMFKVGRHYLLFPGDAQWGPWEKLFENDNAVELLKKASFIKISHHASHNGSPATLMREILGAENHQQGKVYAMISVTPRGGWPIPHEPVLTLLESRNYPFVRSDVFVPQPQVKKNRDIWYELTLP
jgi:beta-lactamase superfamily II metal-dependent hydrolase